MAIEKFNKNMAIIAALDDEPNDVGGLTAAELKAKFDEGGMSIKEYINTVLLPAIEALGVESTVLLPTSAGFKYIRLNADNVLEVSDDGESWTATGAYYYVTNPAAGSVLYQTVQQLSDQQKSTARKNIGAVSLSEVDTAISEALGEYPAALAEMDAVIGGAK